MSDKNLTKAPNLSHELLTPLNAILGMTQILNQDNDLNSQQKEMIQSIHHSGEKLLLLIRKVLNIPNSSQDDVNLSETVTFDMTTSPIHIMVVDDVQVNRFMIQKILSPFANITIDEASDAETALVQMEQRIPHILIIDIFMPGMNGFDAIQLIRQNPLFQSIIIIVMSSDPIDYHREKVNANGIHAYLEKPVKRDKLIAVINDNAKNLSRPDEDCIDMDFVLTANQIPDDKCLSELKMLCNQGAFSDIRTLISSIKESYPEFSALTLKLVTKFQFSEINDRINAFQKLPERNMNPA